MSQIVVTTTEAESHQLVALSGTANFRNLSNTISTLFSNLYSALKENNIKATGFNTVIYHDGPGDTLLATDGGLKIEVGVQISKGVVITAGALTQTNNGVAVSLQVSETPAGLVATAAHIGPYQFLPMTHTIIRQWCAANNYLLTGMNWEVYGDWSDDESKLRTDVFYQLKE